MPWGRPGRRGGPACSRGDGALGVAAGAGLGLVAAVRLDALPALRLVQRQRLGLGRAGLALDALVAEPGGDPLEAQEDRPADASAPSFGPRVHALDLPSRGAVAQWLQGPRTRRPTDERHGVAWGK